MTAFVMGLCYPINSAAIVPRSNGGDIPGGPLRGDRESALTVRRGRDIPVRAVFA